MEWLFQPLPAGYMLTEGKCYFCARPGRLEETTKWHCQEAINDPSKTSLDDMALQQIFSISNPYWINTVEFPGYARSPVLPVDGPNREPSNKTSWKWKNISKPSFFEGSMLVFDGVYLFWDFILGAPRPTLNPQLQHNQALRFCKKKSCDKNATNTAILAKSLRFYHSKIKNKCLFRQSKRFHIICTSLGNLT